MSEDQLNSEERGRLETLVETGQPMLSSDRLLLRRLLRSGASSSSGGEGRKVVVTCVSDSFDGSQYAVSSGALALYAGMCSEHDRLPADDVEADEKGATYEAFDSRCIVCAYRELLAAIRELNDTPGITDCCTRSDAAGRLLSRVDAEVTPDGGEVIESRGDIE